INNPAGAQEMKLTFSYLDAANNWWWAIDNLIVAGEPVPIFAENFDSREVYGRLASLLEELSVSSAR
ncbi:MAG: hypothetical protein QF652_04555, partial [Dehalococcoidia bacterium]|nr:hypothetical protein [Dehalococcoidia bacterium]